MARAGVLACLTFAAFAGCGDEPRSSKPVTVAATTTQVADLAHNVGGDRVDVRGILRPNADPHDYEPRPSDARSVAESKLVLRSGGDVDGWLSGLLESAGGGVPVVTLIDSAERRPGDPHWWQDPRNAERAVARIRDELTRVDPAGRKAYARNAEAYLRKLRALDRAIARCLATVPDSKRKLVTSHDAFGYYAARYGVEVVGAVIPAMTTQGQPSAGETAELAETIRRERVTTIFAESEVDPKVEEAIAREAGAEVGRPLWTDSLGPRRSSGATYLGALAANTRALVEGFGGNPVRCELRAAQ